MQQSEYVRISDGTAERYGLWTFFICLGILLIVNAYLDVFVAQSPPQKDIVDSWSRVFDWGVIIIGVLLWYRKIKKQTNKYYLVRSTYTPTTEQQYEQTLRDRRITHDGQRFPHTYHA